MVVVKHYMVGLVKKFKKQSAAQLEKEYLALFCYIAKPAKQPGTLRD